MLDPFPLKPASLSHYGTDLAKWLAVNLKFPTLPLHLHEVLLSALFYHVMCSVVSPMMSRALVPRIYNSLNRRTRINWDVHVVSLVQSVTISVLAIYIIKYDRERAEMDYRGRIWGYTGSSGLIQALATGYFLWDLYVSVRYFVLFGPGILAHAISALTVYSLGFRPFVNYYAPVFILYELSSPFLNIHWFCDKLNLTGSDIQLYNGILLMLTFFGSRLCWGNYQSVRVFKDIFDAMQYQQSEEGKAWLALIAKNTEAHNQTAESFVRKSIEPIEQVWGTVPPVLVPQWVALAYLISNLILNTLNIVWFGRMITTLRARFEQPWGTRPKGSTGIAMAKGVDAAGVKSVELQTTEVRKRSKKA